MPLNEEFITSFVSILNEVAKKAAESASKLTNLEIEAGVSQYGESFVKEEKVLVEEASPLLTIQNTLNENDPILVLVKSDFATMLADKMMGQSSEDPAFTEDKHEAYSNAVLQSTKAALESFPELTSGGLQLGDHSLTIVDPANEESQKVSVAADRYLFEITLKIDATEERSVFVDLSSQSINAVLSLFQESVDNQETVGDFMGADFAEIVDSHDPNNVDTARNLNLLMDIRLGLIVELGRAEMHLKDILKLTKGSIIELDRLSGEPVDLFVNNKLIARGEVVVIDDNFGLRINQLAGNKETKLLGKD